MKLHISRLATTVLCLISLLWFLPYMYQRFTRADRFLLTGQYSQKLDQFIKSEISTSGVSFKGEDEKIYTQKEARLLMPLVYISDASKWEAFPLELKGQRITEKQAWNSSQYSGIRPSDVNAFTLPLHVLYESEPEGSSMEAPTDIMRVSKNSFDFIIMDTGKIDKQKSELFTKKALEAGVSFPLKKLATNPSPLKSFDEGAFFIDNNSTLFHLKMVRARPVFRDTGITVTEEVLYLNVEEHPQKHHYGLLLTDKAVYLNLYNGQLQEMPIGDYSPDKHYVAMRSDFLNWSLSKKDMSEAKNPTEFIATDKNFNKVRSYAASLPEDVLQRQELVSKGMYLISPFSIVQFNTAGGGVKFILNTTQNWLISLMGIALSLVAYALVCRLGKRTFSVYDVSIVALTGLPGLISILCFGPLDYRGNCSRCA